MGEHGSVKPNEPAGLVRLARCLAHPSFARDQAIHSDRDVDLLVSFQPGRKDFDAYLELVDHLETLLAVSVLGEALDGALSA